MITVEGWELSMPASIMVAGEYEIRDTLVVYRGGLEDATIRRVELESGNKLHERIWDATEELRDALAAFHLEYHNGDTK